MKFIARYLNLIGILLLASFAAAAAGLYFGLPERVHAAPAKAGTTQFTCPMHPEIVRSSSGNCPECSMQFVALRAGDANAETQPAKGCCSSKPATTPPADAMTCPHLASLTTAVPAGCCPHE